MMGAEPDAETSVYCSCAALGREDREEAETGQEAMPITSWNELSIIDRVGLNSVEMTEKDLETAFSQMALAFCCDQYTLKQRLQAEEHARNLAEENIQLELTRGRETLETLKGLCLDSERSEILQRLEVSLDILGGTVERISSTAEVLGAVHQEARMSRAVEIMVAHVENLRRRNDRSAAELEEAKNIIDFRASPDPDESGNRKKSIQQNNGHQRVSISFISSQPQERIKRDLMKQTYRTCPSPSPSSESSCSALAKGDCNSVDDSSLLDILRQRHMGKSALSKKKAEMDKKSKNTHQRLSVRMYGSVWRQCRLAHWRWALLCMCLLVLFCVIALTYFWLETSRWTT